jgi:16S rRNA A1518/A1519 N6-dimethyltransferase RsmA/KsgA/DIM1 with predicted DNA glycosylase/AP lyase activity
VAIEPRGSRAVPPEREDALWGLVQSGFRERRKMLRNVLAHLYLEVDQARLHDVLLQ